jgi:hypothetical protein
MSTLINHRDFNASHGPRERPALIPRPNTTCSMCKDWRNIDARPRCVSERSPFWRRPREGGLATVVDAKPEPTVRAEPEPKAKSVRYRTRRKRNPEYDALMARNAQQKV